MLDPDSEFSSEEFDADPDLALNIDSYPVIAYTNPFQIFFWKTGHFKN
jgi:hypothetical protein